MKKIIIIPFLAGLISLSPGCIEDTVSTEFAAGSQAGVSKTALNALANATSAFMYAYDYFGTLSSQEFGYPAMMIMCDALTDCPYVSSNYNHFSTPWGGEPFGLLVEPHQTTLALLLYDDPQRQQHHPLGG